MLQGYWASEWHDAYRRTYHIPTEETPKDKSKRLISMERWQSQVIHTVWMSMIGLWQLRNDNRHGRDKETWELARHKVLTNELKELYQNRDQYPVEVQNLLRNSVEEHCGNTSSQIEDWFSVYRMTFKVMEI
jgi:hypothetical protein